MDYSPGLNTLSGAIAVKVEDSSGTIIDPAREGFNIKTYDYISFTYNSSTQTTIVFKAGGSGGTTVATIVLVYTDATQANLSTVTKT